MSHDVLNKVREFLKESGVDFREVRHEPTATSEESARARGEDLRIGGKAILMKVDKAFALFVLSASLRIDSAAVRKLLGAKKIRFASAEELLELTGLAPGAVPPFGRPILPFDLYVDESVRINDKIAFNAGSLTDSIVITTEDYFRVARARVALFAEKGYRV